MPEMPKWLIVLIVVCAGWWIFVQVADFVGKVNTTIGKANSSMNASEAQYKRVTDK